jgi:hypothetical protein
LEKKKLLFCLVEISFSLSDAQRVFTIIMRKVVRKIRGLWNSKTIIYLDDLVFLHKDPNHLKKASERWPNS